MKTKLVLKLSILLFALVLVVLVRQGTESGGFRKSVNELFGLESVPKLHWCVDQAVDVEWAAPVAERLKKLNLKDYCDLKTEPLSGVDADKVEWQSLAVSTGPTGQKALLEWNKQYMLFKAGGMPFKSSDLARELVDK